MKTQRSRLFSVNLGKREVFVRTDGRPDLPLVGEGVTLRFPHTRDAMFHLAVVALVANKHHKHRSLLHVSTDEIKADLINLITVGVEGRKPSFSRYEDVLRSRWQPRTDRGLTPRRGYSLYNVDRCRVDPPIVLRNALGNLLCSNVEEGCLKLKLDLESLKLSAADIVTPDVQRVVRAVEKIAKSPANRERPEEASLPRTPTIQPEQRVRSVNEEVSPVQAALNSALETFSTAETFLGSELLLDISTNREHLDLGRDAVLAILFSLLKAPDDCFTGCKDLVCFLGDNLVRPLFQCVASIIGDYPDGSQRAFPAFRDDASAANRLFQILEWANLPSTAPIAYRFVSFDDVDARKRAVALLGAFGNAHALQVLRRYAKDDECGVRIAAAKALGRIGSTEGRRALLDLLEDDDSHVQQAAARTLRDAGTEGVEDGLLRMLKNEQPDDRRRTLWLLEGAKPTHAVACAVRRLLDDDDEDVSIAAVETLSSFKITDDIPTLGAVARSHRRTRKVIAAIAALGRYGSRAALDIVLNLLKCSRIEVRSIAAETGTRLVRNGFGPEVCVWAVRQRPRVRRLVVDMIAAAAPADAARFLRQALTDDSDACVRRRCAFLLSGYEDAETRSALLSSMSDPSPLVRKAVLGSLLRIGGQDVAGAIQAAVNDKSPIIARNARMFLDRTMQGTHAGITDVVSDDGDDEMTSLLADLEKHLYRNDLGRALSNLLQHPHPQFRYWALTAGDSLGYAARWVNYLCHSSDVTQRAIGVRLQGNLAEADTALVTQMMRDDAWLVRAEALRAFWHLATPDVIASLNRHLYNDTASACFLTSLDLATVLRDSPGDEASILPDGGKTRARNLAKRLMQKYEISCAVCSKHYPDVSYSVFRAGYLAVCEECTLKGDAVSVRNQKSALRSLCSFCRGYVRGPMMVRIETVSLCGSCFDTALQRIEWDTPAGMNVADVQTALESRHPLKSLKALAAMEDNPALRSERNLCLAAQALDVGGDAAMWRGLRDRLLRKLVQIGPQCIGHLTKEIASGSWIRKANIALCLCAFAKDNEIAIDALEQLAGDEDPRVRRYVVSAIGQIRNERVRRIALRLTSDEDAETRRGAVRMLKLQR